MPFTMSPGDSAPVTCSPGDTAFVKLNRGTAETARHYAAVKDGPDVARASETAPATVVTSLWLFLLFLLLVLLPRMVVV